MKLCDPRSLVVLVLLSMPGFVGAQTPGPPLALSADQARDSVQWLVDLAVLQLPPTYEGNKHWDDTKRVWSGVSVKRDGLELKTHRRFKDVRHGRWVKYTLTLPRRESVGEPLAATPTTSVVIHSVEQTSDYRWQVSGSVVTPLEFDCRVERWNLGLQWYSVNVTGHLRVRMDFTASLSMSADYSEIPPAVVVDPKIETATLDLEHFEVDRISKIGGDVADELGDILEKVIREVFLEKENTRLAERLNKSIDKKREKLRFSLTTWFAKWQ